MTIQNIVTSVLENVKEQTDKKQDVLPDGVKGQILVKKSADETEWKDPGEVPDVYTQAEQRMLGAYNLLPNNYQSQTENGVTITRNADGTLELNGTSTKSTRMWISISNIQEDEYNRKLFGKKLKFVCISSFNSDITAGLYMNEIGLIWASGNGGTIFTAPIFNTNFDVKLIIQPNATFDHFIVKPMITTDLNATCDDYVPYAMSNYDLTYRQPEVVTGYTVDSNYMLNVTEATFNVTRIGKLVVININCEFAATATGWLTFVTGLPRPVAYAYGVLCNSSNNTTFIKLQLGTNGNLVKSSDYSTAAGWHSGQIVYFTID